MATFRDFEVLYENIVHMHQSLTINQAMAILMVESFEFTLDEKIPVSLVVCKLEFLRGKNKYTEEMGLEMYPIICDIFTEKTKLENFLLLENYLDQYMAKMGIKMTRCDYNRIIPVVGKYFRFNANNYKDEVYEALHFNPPVKPMVEKVTSVPEQTPKSHPTQPLKIDSRGWHMIKLKQKVRGAIRKTQSFYGK